MAFLDWTNGSFSGQFVHTVGPKSQLVLKIQRQEQTSLIQELEGVFLRSEGELRLVLSDQWVLYWKQRESGSRALVAHPEANLWVGTIALDPQDGTRFLL